MRSACRLVPPNFKTLNSAWFIYQFNPVTNLVHANTPAEGKWYLCWSSLLKWGHGDLTLILAL